MSKADKNKSSILNSMFDSGSKKLQSHAEVRYLQISNIAAVLGATFMLVWMFIAIYLTDDAMVYGSNGLMGLLFLLVLFFNKKGWRVFASSWLIISSYVSLLLFLYLLGYSSGVSAICFLIIIMPFLSFPRKARSLAFGFSVLALITLIATVMFQEKINPHHEVMDPHLLQVLNTSITGFICLTLVWSLSVLIDQSEESLLAEQKKSDDLLHNILPMQVVKDLKETGKTIPKRHQNVSILFTDFIGFTELVASISAITLVKELNDIFGKFDEIVEKAGVEKIETIGDAYVAACGLEQETAEHASRCIQAAEQMLSYLEKRNKEQEIKWEMRVGVHSGPIVAGVVGKKKFSYDLFGDTINTASRMESSGASGKINVSGATQRLVKHAFNCEYRGEIPTKGKGAMDMYFIKKDS